MSDVWRFEDFELSAAVSLLLLMGWPREDLKKRFSLDFGCVTSPDRNS